VSGFRFSTNPFHPAFGYPRVAGCEVQATGFRIRDQRLLRTEIEVAEETEDPIHKWGGQSGGILAIRIDLGP
jgi:hypothetical protein